MSIWSSCPCPVCVRDRRLRFARLLRGASVACTVAIAVLLVGVAVLSAGCGTVTPPPVASESASYDGNEQTSGIISVTPAGVLVTDRFRARYNALVATYGRDFAVPLRVDEGLISVEPNRWLIDRGHFTQFLEMNAWRRAGLAPKASAP